jgi:hypothetical protein
LTESFGGKLLPFREIKTKQNKTKIENVNFNFQNFGSTFGSSISLKITQIKYFNFMFVWFFFLARAYYFFLKSAGGNGPGGTMARAGLGLLDA